jgi:hypothetical protein
MVPGGRKIEEIAFSLFVSPCVSLFLLSSPVPHIHWKTLSEESGSCLLHIPRKVKSQGAKLWTVMPPKFPPPSQDTLGLGWGQVLRDLCSLHTNLILPAAQSSKDTAYSKHLMCANAVNKKVTLFLIT